MSYRTIKSVLGIFMHVDQRFATRNGNQIELPFNVNYLFYAKNQFVQVQFIIFKENLEVKD